MSNNNFDNDPDLLLALLPSFEIAFTNVDGMQPGEDYRRVDVACGGGDDE